MSEKQSVSDYASAGGPGPSEQLKAELNLGGPTELGIFPIAEHSKEEFQAERFAYVKRKIEENRKKLLEITTERARAAAEAAAEANRQGNLHPFLRPDHQDLQRFEGLTSLGISDDESSTIIATGRLVYPMEGEEEKK